MSIEARIAAGKDNIMDDEKEQYKPNRVKLREIADVMRKTLTKTYITKLATAIRSRANHGFLFYQTEPVPDSICREQLTNWVKECGFDYHSSVDDYDVLIIRW